MTVTSLPPFFDPRLCDAALRGDDVLLRARDPRFITHWAMTRQVAHDFAHAMGVQVVPIRREKDTLVLGAPPGRSDGLTPLQPGGKRFEEEGGPGLEAIFEFVGQHSALPILDVRELLRWVVVCYILGHTEVNAGHVVLSESAGSMRLAPFPFFTVFPAAAGGPAYPLAKGFLIGKEWSKEHLRVDHWSMLAKWARVRPKVVFGLQRDLARQGHRTFMGVLAAVYRNDVYSSVPQLLQKAVAARCTRLLDLVVSAPKQGVAGMGRPAEFQPAESP